MLSDPKSARSTIRLVSTPTISTRRRRKPPRAGGGTGGGNSSGYGGAAGGQGIPVDFGGFVSATCSTSGRRSNRAASAAAAWAASKIFSRTSSPARAARRRHNRRRAATWIPGSDRLFGRHSRHRGAPEHTAPGDLRELSRPRRASRCRHLPGVQRQGPGHAGRRHMRFNVRCPRCNGTGKARMFAPCATAKAS